MQVDEIELPSTKLAIYILATFISLWSNSDNSVKERWGGGYKVLS